MPSAKPSTKAALPGVTIATGRAQRAWVSGQREAVSPQRARVRVFSAHHCFPVPNVLPPKPWCCISNSTLPSNSSSKIQLPSWTFWNTAFNHVLLEFFSFPNTKYDVLTEELVFFSYKQDRRIMTKKQVSWNFALTSWKVHGQVAHTSVSKLSHVFQQSLIKISSSESPSRANSPAKRQLLNTASYHEINSWHWHSKHSH